MPRKEIPRTIEEAIEFAENFPYMRNYVGDNDRGRRNQLILERRLKKRIQGIEYLGGKCKKCGGEFHPVAMDFHHRDKDDKTTMHLSHLPWKKMKAELDKCDLVCANCHRVLEYELMKTRRNGN